MTLVKNAAIAVLAALALAGCQTMSDMGSSASNTVSGWFSGGKSVKVNLTGNEEVPSVSTPASGTGSFNIAEDGTVKGSVTTSGVSGTMAHIHRGAKGQNGPVAIGLVKNGDTYSVPDGAKLSEADMKLFKAGDLYVNVHSAAHKGGEVRAQLQP
jgi:predicted small secreted protein